MDQRRRSCSSGETFRNCTSHILHIKAGCSQGLAFDAARLLTLIFKVVLGTLNAPIHLTSGFAGRYSISYLWSMNAIMSLISCTAKKRPGQLSLP